jgi:uncharacterized lipoprotein YmbA
MTGQEWDRCVTSRSRPGGRLRTGGSAPPTWLAILILTAGCGGTIPKTRYYVLALPAPAPQAHDAAPFTAAVMPFRAPDQLEQDRIVYRPSAVEIDFYEYHRWAERPATTLTTALVERLRAQRLFSTVAVFDGKGRPDYLIRGRVDRLEEVDSPEGVSVQVQLSAEAVDGKTLKTVWTSSASHSGPVNHGEVAAVVTEISRGVDACLTQLTTSLDSFVRAAPR